MSGLPAASLVAVAVATVIAACGAPETRSGVTTAPAASSNAAAGQATAAPSQLQFSTKTLAGQPFSGESLAGKPAVLWFWAPWCPTCQQEAPALAKVAASNPHVTFVGVAARDQVSSMQSFVDKYHLGGLTQLADTDGTVWAKFGITRQPAWAFIRADGSVDVVKGQLTEAELAERVSGLTNR
ncbi:protein disulfide oxidoreductase [Mycobacterium sp. THU-M104]|uniref:protein disulfide oxidoreductase n=1 Tax=Mycobacterium sp. THU-M104 TaxID=3410515 RepID=UPI003B99DF65